ncbi:MAG: hypothetical protein JXQ72_15935 [Anaerolineae bacterium]|nr:hypothetical protein [Anaerolineae bacterium]
MSRSTLIVMLATVLLVVILAGCGQENKKPNPAEAILQHTAQEAMHYAVTGQWDEAKVASVIGYTIPTELDDDARRAAVLNALVPCTEDFDPVFFDHWGQDCDPDNRDDANLRRDMARLITVAVLAHDTAAELNPAPGLRITGLNLGDGELNTETVSENDPGWFHVGMCSSRESLTDREHPPRYRMVGEGSAWRCELAESIYQGRTQDDLGDQCDRITVVISYNQPQEDGGYVRLEASASGKNECYSTRVTNLPPQLLLPTLTPSPTLEPVAGGLFALETPDCALPCFLGIVPGQTDKHEVAAIASAYASISPNTASDFFDIQSETGGIHVEYTAADPRLGSYVSSIRLIAKEPGMLTTLGALLDRGYTPQQVFRYRVVGPNAIVLVIVFTGDAHLIATVSGDGEIGPDSVIDILTIAAEQEVETVLSDKYYRLFNDWQASEIPWLGYASIENYDKVTPRRVE